MVGPYRSAIFIMREIMPITKRKIPKKKPSKPKVKLSPAQRKHNDKCAKYYNRLQADLDDDSLMELVAKVTKQSGITYYDPYLAAEQLLRRFDAQVVTLQINYPDHYAFQVTLAYTDRTKKPKFGYLYPSKTVVKTSPRLVHSVMLAYVELCKHTGRFI